MEQATNHVALISNYWNLDVNTTTMADQLFNEANALFVDENYDAALKLYDEAISKASVPSAEMFIKRSACHMKLDNNTGSIWSDAHLT